MQDKGKPIYPCNSPSRLTGVLGRGDSKITWALSSRTYGCHPWLRGMFPVLTSLTCRTDHMEGNILSRPTDG
jgi:hypothetical protein